MDQVLICGDHNAPGFNDCSNIPGLRDEIETLGLEQHVNSQTQNAVAYLGGHWAMNQQLKWIYLMDLAEGLI